ncbi:MAG: GAF domain-containing protein, partial [Actinobacteria bacterium]|nr:GAF domain-containing protein [Actinomycetota bacterium]
MRAASGPRREVPGALDDFLELLCDVTALVGARSEADVLRRAVEAACRATGARRGVAGRVDGAAATSDARYEVGADWKPAPGRWAAGDGAPGVVCLTVKPLLGSGSPGGRESAPVVTGVSGMERFACVPLGTDASGPALGFLAVGDRDDAFGERDLRLLVALGETVSLRLREVAGEGRLLTADHAASFDIAERLQRRLSPPEPPQLEGLDIAFS